jgi:hypothetical protein
MNLRKETSRALVDRGYRRDGRIHLLSVDPEFSLWVDTGPLGPRVDIAPFVGLRHEAVENLAEAKAKKSLDELGVSGDARKAAVDEIEE